MSDQKQISYDNYTCATIDLKDLKKPLSRLASDMDRSLNWLVRKMLEDHPFLADYVDEKKKKHKAELV